MAEALHGIKGTSGSRLVEIIEAIESRLRLFLLLKPFDWYAVITLNAVTELVGRTSAAAESDLLCQACKNGRHISGSLEMSRTKKTQIPKRVVFRRGCS
jgi:hypothetical protein